MNFYRKYTNYLYDKEKCFDNYVGLIIKCLRAFYKYLENYRDVPFGGFLCFYHVPCEEIPIIALSPTQLRYIIHSKEQIDSLDEKLLEISDCFIFGCTVALRFSDLMKRVK